MEGPGLTLESSFIQRDRLTLPNFTLHIVVELLESRETDFTPSHVFLLHIEEIILQVQKELPTQVSVAYLLAVMKCEGFAS